MSLDIVVTRFDTFRRLIASDCQFSINMQNISLFNVDIGDPVEMAKKYYEQGVDELVFYDIMASARGRGPILDLISRVAEQVFIPFCVGGGIGSIEDIRSTILAGAEKVSLNSQAVKNRI